MSRAKNKSKGASHKDSWGKSDQVRGTASAKLLMQSDWNFPVTGWNPGRLQERGRKEREKK